jgi:hypothetical protein
MRDMQELTWNPVAEAILEKLEGALHGLTRSPLLRHEITDWDVVLMLAWLLTWHIGGVCDGKDDPQAMVEVISDFMKERLIVSDQETQAALAADKRRHQADDANR